MCVCVVSETEWQQWGGVEVRPKAERWTGWGLGVHRGAGVEMCVGEWLELELQQVPSNIGNCTQVPEVKKAIDFFPLCYLATFVHFATTPSM